MKKMNTKKMISMESINKKTISLWISFILMIVFVIMLSVLTMSWMKNRAVGGAYELKRAMNQELECHKVNIMVKSNDVNNNIINITITNTGTWRIDKVMIEFFNNSLPQSIEEYDSVLRPGTNKTLSITKQGDVMYITPIVNKDNFKLLCPEKKVRIKVEG